MTRNFLYPWREDFLLKALRRPETRNTSHKHQSCEKRGTDFTINVQKNDIQPNRGDSVTNSKRQIREDGTDNGEPSDGTDGSNRKNWYTKMF